MPQPQGDAPNGLLVFLAGVIVLSTLIFLIWGVPAIIAWARGRCWSFPTQARIMSRHLTTVPATKPIETEQRPQALDQHGNTPEQATGTVFPSLIAAWEQLDDDARLDILAQVRDAEGEWLYAESRVARFIGGRVEDRIKQVREVRGIEPRAAPIRMLHVRDSAGERAIPFDAEQQQRAG